MNDQSGHPTEDSEVGFRPHIHAFHRKDQRADQLLVDVAAWASRRGTSLILYSVHFEIPQLNEPVRALVFYSLATDEVEDLNVRELRRMSAEERRALIERLESESEQ